MAIIELQPEVYERIAAGEVIDRPSSVVKELVENSIDAQATQITVALEAGGRDLIEITDNGSGMTQQDLAICIRRHATSKIRSVEDLEKIQTLGFRGEALASVAAVSELEILSRAPESNITYQLQADPFRQSKKDTLQSITHGHFLGSPHGTRIQARSLFVQIPARLKFLKSPRAELQNVREWMEKIAISHPEIGFQLLHNGKTCFNVKKQELKDRVKNILDDQTDLSLVHEKTKEDSISVQSYWIQGSSLPTTKKLIQIVNGRTVKDRLLQQAVLGPFKQTLLPGKFPAFVLLVEIDPSQIDVNVHPTKTEVRFLDSGKIFKIVKSHIEKMIETRGAFSYSTSAPQSFGFHLSERPLPRPSYQTASKTSWNLLDRPPEPSASEPSTPVSDATENNGLSHPIQNLQKVLREGNYAGCFFKTYLAFEIDQDLTVIDQHAAHERIRYEKLKKQVFNEKKSPPSQSLLLPEAIRMSPGDFETVSSRLSILKELGFESEIFGDSTILFRSVPTIWGENHLPSRLKNLLERLAHVEENHSELALDEELFEKLASEACHSSVRSGDTLQEPQARALFKDLLECTHPWNCPHGRPTLLKLKKTQLEQWFQRKL